MQTDIHKLRILKGMIATFVIKNVDVKSSVLSEIKQKKSKTTMNNPVALNNLLKNTNETNNFNFA